MVQHCDLAGGIRLAREMGGSAEAVLMLGGQQLLCMEKSGPENLDPIVWPCTAVSAKDFWSGSRDNICTALQPAIT